MRMAVHAGEVNYDEHGVTGTAINLAFRLLEAHQLKEALKDSAGELAIIVSSWFFEEVVRHSTAADAGYHSVHVTVKETIATAWGSTCRMAPTSLLRKKQGTCCLSSPERAHGLYPPRTLPRDTAVFTGRAGEMDLPGDSGPSGSGEWGNDRHLRCRRDGWSRQDRICRARRSSAR